METTAKDALQTVDAAPRGPWTLELFYTACRHAGFVLCPICCAYRQPVHEACGPEYLFRDLGRGLARRATTQAVEPANGLTLADDTEPV